MVGNINKCKIGSCRFNILEQNLIIQALSKEVTLIAMEGKYISKLI